MSYAEWWSRCWSVLAAVGVGIGALVWSPLVVLGLAGFVWACVAVGLLLLGTSPARTGAGYHGSGLGRRATAVTGGFVAALAVTTASPPVGLLVCSLAGLTSPVVVRRLAPRRTTPEVDVATGPTEGATPGLVEQPGTSIGQLTDGELCRLWRGTFWELQGRHTPEQLLRMVAVRQSCLDELERRHPSALHAWLVSGARASAGPEKFLGDDRNPGSADAA